MSVNISCFAALGHSLGSGLLCRLNANLESLRHFVLILEARVIYEVGLNRLGL